MDDLSFFWVIAYKYEAENGGLLSSLMHDYFGDGSFDEWGMLFGYTWQDFADKAQEILFSFISQHPTEEWPALLQNVGPVFQMGGSCCGTPVWSPYTYWSELTWDLLDAYATDNDKQVRIIKWLPCMNCRNNSTQFIQNGVVDIQGLKTHIQSQL